jgi:hypothetical protein
VEDSLEINHSKCSKEFFLESLSEYSANKRKSFEAKGGEEPYCPICEKEPETVLHALWGCPAAADVWGNSKRSFQKCPTQGESFMK